MLDGSRARDLMTASPRNMCVPGVHACATAGVSSSASRTAAEIRPADTARVCARDMCRDLDPDALALAANSFAEIVKLVLHDIVDCIARRVDVLAHLLDHVVYRYPIDHFFAAFHGSAKSPPRTWRSPSRALSRTPARPTRALEPVTAGPLRAFGTCKSGQCGTAACIPQHRANGSASRWSTSQQEGDAGADRCADESGGQQVILLLTLLVQFHFLVG